MTVITEGGTGPLESDDCGEEVILVVLDCKVIAGVYVI